MAEKYYEIETIRDVILNNSYVKWNYGDIDPESLMDALEFYTSAADVLPRDEGIKLGAELAAMHGATPEQQQLETAYFKGVEYGLTRRDVRPMVRGKWVNYGDEYRPDIKCCVCGQRKPILLGNFNFNYCPQLRG